jgi:hypothetical protein
MPLGYPFWGEVLTGVPSFPSSEHLHSTGSDVERKRYSILLHGFLFIGHHLCARNVFSRMKLSWHTSELPVHVYFKILWENRYKKSYSLIYDQFIARIHFILFKRECPRLSVVAKKMISKVGHWYLDERDTYIRVFRATRAPHLLPVYVPDRLEVGEICYQTILQGYNATLVKDKKQGIHTLWIPYRFLPSKMHRTS